MEHYIYNQALIDEAKQTVDTLEYKEYLCETRIRELSCELEKQYALLHYINVCRSRLVTDYSLNSEEVEDE